MTALWILCSSFCSASIIACIQYLGETLGFLDIAFVEFIFVLAVTSVVMLVRGIPFRTELWPLHLLRSVIGVGVVVTQIITATHMPVAATQTLQYTSPLFVACFVSIAALKNNENLDWRVLASIAAAFSGICVMFHPSARTFSSVYVSVGLLCGFLTALSILLLKKLGSRDEPVSRTIFYFHLHGTALLGVAEFFCGNLQASALQQPPLALLLILLVFSHYARTHGWGKGNTLLASVLSFSGVVFATLIDRVVFQEIPGVRTMAGMCIIVVAAAVCLILVAGNEKRKTLGRVVFEQSSDGNRHKN